MPILGLILSLTVVWGFIDIIFEVLPPDLSHDSIIILTIVGLILSFLAFVGSHSSNLKIKGARISEIGLVIGIFAFVGYAILGTDSIVMRERERESQVKQTIHGLQGCITEYKIKHQGLPPQSIKDLEPIIPDYLLRTKNPFNPHQIYLTSTGGLINGIPKDYGIIGYIAPANPKGPYKFIFLVRGYKDGGKPIPYFIDENNVAGVLKISR